MIIDQEIIDGFLYYTEKTLKFYSDYSTCHKDQITVYYSKKIGFLRKRNVIKTKSFYFQRASSSTYDAGSQTDDAIKFKQFFDKIEKDNKKPAVLDELEKDAIERLGGSEKDDFAYGMLYVIGKVKEIL